METRDLTTSLRRSPDSQGTSGSRETRVAAGYEFSLSRTGSKEVLDLLFDLRFRGGYPSRLSRSFIHNFAKANQINTKRGRPQNTDKEEADFRHSILQIAKLQGIWIKF